MRAIARALLLLTLSGAASACTGLMAGEVTQSSRVVPLGRDSVWARTRRAMTAEVFSYETVDSVAGLLYGVRHPRPGTLEADPLSCRLHVTFQFAAQADQTELGTTTQFTVPRGKNGSPTAQCGPELAGVLERIDATIVTGR